MNALYLIAIILGVSGQNVLKKPYTQKNGQEGVFFFNGLLSGAALLFFVCTGSDLQFEWAVLPYAAAFAAAYATACVFLVLAVATGSLSLSSLLVSYSLMLPAVYGLIFLGDPVTFGLIPGMILLMVSLLLINKREKNAKISLKWVIFVTAAFVGNGMCTIVMNMQQMKFDGAYKNEFMIMALMIVTAVMAVLCLCKERKNLKQYAKTGWLPASASGILNGMVNLFVMLLTGKMPISVMFPLISAGGLIVTYLVSKFVYKEKLTRLQFAGFVMGLAAVVFLNL